MSQHLSTEARPPLNGGKPILGLAPMAGITDMPMRALCYRMGANYACTEMVSAMGWMSARKTLPVYTLLMDTAPEESNTALQLFGRDPVLMAEAAARACELQRFTSIDINMGCPARKVTSGGEGSALLKTPDLAAKIMEVVKRHSSLPVTVKTRLGYDDTAMNALILAQAAESLGLQWISIHGRTREQQYAGRADHAAIAAIKRQVRIPVLANGDIFAPEDVPRILAETGCDGVLIGRGAMGNPWLFRGARQAMAGETAQRPALAERLEVALEHVDRMIAFKGEHLGVVEMRKHIGHYIAGVRGASAMRRALNDAKTAEEQKTLLRALFARATQEEEA